MSDEKTQKLVLSIIDFLNGAIEDGTVKTDDREGLEVAGIITLPAIIFCHTTASRH